MRFAQLICYCQSWIPISLSWPNLSPMCLFNKNNLDSMLWEELNDIHWWTHLPLNIPMIRFPFPFLFFYEKVGSALAVLIQKNGDTADPQCKIVSNRTQGHKGMSLAWGPWGHGPPSEGHRENHWGLSRNRFCSSCRRISPEFSSCQHFPIISPPMKSFH